MTNVIQLSKSQGFTRMDHDLYEALISADLSGRELRVAMAIHRHTTGFNRESVRVSASYIAQMTGLARENVSRAVSELLRQRVIYREGGSRSPIGICQPKEWNIDAQSRVSKSSQSVKVITLSVTHLTHKKYKTQTPLIFLRKIPSPISIRPIVSCDWKPEPVRFVNGVFIVQPEVLSKWAKAFPTLDLDGEIARAGTWAESEKPKKDWQRFLAGWLRRAFGKVGAVSEAGVPVDKIIDLYHKTCPNFPEVSVRSDAALRAMIVERWNESPDQQSGQAFWHPFFLKAARRNQVFYRGNNVQPRLEAILTRANFRDIAEAQS